MNSARKRISTYLVHLPFRRTFLPHDGDDMQERQQLGLKYTGIPFGDPGAAAATGRKKSILRIGSSIGLKRGF